MNQPIFKGAALLVCFMGGLGLAQGATNTLRITSFRNGELVWTNSVPGSYYQIQWSSPVLGIGNWQSSYESLTDIRPEELLAVTSAVPMLYRVVSTNIPSRPFTLSVLGGSGGGSYHFGDSVGIEANAPQPFKTFDRWTGDTANVVNVSNAATWVTVYTNMALAATYRDQLFTLEVDRGSGDGNYANGQVVPIAADNPPPAFQVFDRWTGDVGQVANVSNANTTIRIMGAGAEVEATYRDVLFALKVSGGGGSGTGYVYGTNVPIQADEPEPFKTFVRWTGDTQHVANVSAASTTIRILGTNVSVTATYGDVPCTLSVTDGSGDGSYVYGQAAAIQANSPTNEFRQFDRWTGDTNHVRNVLAENTTVEIRETIVQVAATYRDKRFALTVFDGSGSGSYTNGHSVPLVANTSPYFRAFKRWTGDVQGVASVTNANTAIRIPGTNVAVTATYHESPVSKTFPTNAAARGVPWPTPRFTIGTGVSTNCVTDNLTGLTWLRNPESIMRTFAGAQSYCELMNVTTNGGYADWRLPSVKELFSLADFRYLMPSLPNTSGVGQMINGQPFSNITSTGYWWSETPNLKGYLYVWSFYVYNGSLTASDKSQPNCFTWPVRGGL